MTNPPKTGLPSLLVAAFLFLSLPATARQAITDASPVVTPLFANHSPLSVTIEAPLTTLMTERPDEKYLDGTFSYTAGDGALQVFDLKLRTRGSYRRQKKHCDFAPIRLNFRKKQVAELEFAGQDKLKLVTHCQNGRPHYRQLLLREFLAYRILQLMTDKSYGVRLLQINYIDTEGAEPMTSIGFVIEDDDAIAERIGMLPVSTSHITYDDLERQQANLINVFQFLIGNTDYSLVNREPGENCCHNADLMSATEGPPFTPLPYDFDFAGLVNAPYAEPNPQLDLRSVRQRLYRGRCSNNELLPATFERFFEKKDAVYGIVAELELFNAESRRDITRYLDAFYDSISQSRRIKSRFIDRCVYQ